MNEIIKKVDIQVLCKYPKGWKTVCTVDCLQEETFLKFVRNNWKGLDCRVVNASDSGEILILREFKGRKGN